jgi:hypothetical protein
VACACAWAWRRGCGPCGVLAGAPLVGRHRVKVAVTLLCTHTRTLPRYELETVALKRTVDRYRALCDNVINAHQGAALKPSQRLLVRWFKPLSDAIDEEQVGAAPVNVNVNELRLGFSNTTRTVHASRPHTQRLASSACLVARWYQVHTHTHPPIYPPIRIDVAAWPSPRPPQRDSVVLASRCAPAGQGVVQDGRGGPRGVRPLPCAAAPRDPGCSDHQRGPQRHTVQGVRVCGV